MYLGQLCLSKRCSFVFLFIKVVPGRLKGIVLSVCMLRFQYSLKFGVYL